MSKVFKGIATIASIAAMIPGPHQPFAAAISVVASVGAVVTAKKPSALGNTSNIVIGANMPTPYTIGRTYIGGNQVHDVGYGGDKNPYRSMVLIWSGAGPIEEIEAFKADYTTITFTGDNANGYYEDFLYLSTQLGQLPESAALAGPFGAIPQWGAAYKLSGYAAGLITLEFDKDGKRFSAGVPLFGTVIKGVKVYDPRLDDTYTGGAGDHRFDDETTWEWSENPALHAIAYARGRYQNGKKVMGCGFTEVGIDLPSWVEFANVCDANGWKVGGTVYEPGSRWDNLKRICMAGGGFPAFVGAKLSVRFNAPKIALDTIVAADLADGEVSVPAMKTWRDRKNGIIPRYRSEANKWEYVQSELVSVPEYVTEDGEVKDEETQFDLVQDKDQAAQLAAYELVNGREIGPITISCKPRLIEYVPGEALNVDIPEAGLENRLCVIIGRRIDPATAIVELTLETEDTAKHAYALALTGTAPPPPVITDGEDADGVIADNRIPPSAAIVDSFISTPGTGITAADVGATATISIGAHTRRYRDRDVAVNAGSVTGLAFSTEYFVYYDDIDRVGGAVTYAAATTVADAGPSSVNQGRHYVGQVRTPADGAAATTGVTASAPWTIADGVLPGTTAQYWRGDKTWQALTGSAVANVPAGTIAAPTVQAAINELDSEKQAAHANLTTFAGLSLIADRLPYANGAGTLALATFTSVARTLLAQSTQSDMRTTGLGLGTISTQAASAVAITGGTIAGLTAFTQASGNLNVTAGNVVVAADGVSLGGVRLERGNPNGYLGFYNASSVRQGYVGFASGARLVLVAEGSMTGFAVTGDMTISNGLAVTGASTATTWIKSGSYTVGTVPAAATAGAGARIYVSNETGGAVLAFSDATNWRRVTDRAIIA